MKEMFFFPSFMSSGKVRADLATRAEKEIALKK